MAANDDVLDYRAALEAVAMAMAILRQHDLPRLLFAIERADTLGPILHPTLYREKGAAMREDAEVLEAALPLWRLAERVGAGAAR